MLKRIYAVYDSLAQEMFGPLIVMPNDAAARRFFQDAVTGEGSRIAEHPEDYSLHFLGELDTETGVLTSIATLGSGPFGVQIVSADFVLEQLKRRQLNAVAAGEGIGEASING